MSTFIRGGALLERGLSLSKSRGDHVGGNLLDMGLVVMLRALFFSRQSVFFSLAPTAWGEPVTKAGRGVRYHLQDRMKCSGCSVGRMSEESMGSRDAFGMNGGKRAGRRVEEEGRRRGRGRGQRVGANGFGRGRGFMLILGATAAAAAAAAATARPLRNVLASAGQWAVGSAKAGGLEQSKAAQSVPQ